MDPFCQIERMNDQNSGRIMPEELTVETYASCDRSTRGDFEAWILSLNHEQDNEVGAGPDGALAWVREQNAQFEPGSVYATFICKEAQSGLIVATCSIVPDDRKIVKTYNLETNGVFGLFNVRRQFRGRGIGGFLAGFRDRHVQSFADRTNTPMRMHLFTSEPIAEKICQRLGFRRQQTIYVEAFDAQKFLYAKDYVPRLSQPSFGT